MLKVGLVGVGGISTVHISSWEAMEDAELVALCDIRQEQLDKYPNKRHYLNFDEMLAKEDLDILDICLPSYLHADFAVKAMEAGINVITEKPVSLKQEDVKRVYETAYRMNVNFMVAQVIRFWPEYMLLKDIYDSCKYGKLLSGHIWRLGTQPRWSWDGWMADEARSGLVPFDLHVHDLDYMIYTFGTPKNITPRRIKRPEQDYLTAVYDYDDFFITAEAAWYGSRHPFDAGYRFQFEKAVVIYEQNTLKIYQDDRAVQDLTNSDGEENRGDIDLPKTNAYADEIRYFADCVKQKVFPDKIKPEELNQVLHIINSFS